MREKKLTFIILMIAFITSCEKYLDKAPDLGLSDTDVFNNFSTVRGYLDQAYNCIKDFSKADAMGIGNDHCSQIGDEAVNPRPQGSMTGVVNAGTWFGAGNATEVGWGTEDVGNNKGNVIPNAFYGLRIANRVIEKAPLMGSLTEEERSGLLGQAYFFRAWFYFEVIRRVGGMPLMDKVFPTDYEFDEERLTYQQSSDWAIEQLDEAIQLLPDEWPAAETGRVNKAAAYALRSMMELYAASPLMRNPVDRIENNGYDIEYCKKAAEYAKQTLEYINTVVPQHNMMPGDEYKHIFYHSPNFVSDESLFYINSTGQNRNSGGADLATLWQNIEFSNRKGNKGVSHVDPTQNMIDKYETINGYPVKLVGNVWETSDPEFDQNNPFQNRDPRLGMTIILPGEAFGSIQNNINYLCTWVGGRDVAPAQEPIAENLTGYSVKKWQWPSSVHTRLPGGDAGYGDYFYNCIIIRTTQVWLDYAEAMNEAYGPHEKNGYPWSAVDAINMVRERVGMSQVRNEFTTSKEIFRERIRNERAVELMFENHRWFDIRRWMIAKDIFNPSGDPYPLKGVQVTATAVGKYKKNSAFTDKVLPGNVFKYKLKDLTTETTVRVFQTEHYWYPIGKDEIYRFSKLKQNPGW